jgi:hypothetical protein
MRIVTRPIILGVVPMLFVTVAAAQVGVTANTVRLDAGAASPPATLAEMAWLAGSWRGEGLGGVVEEIWSPPSAGSMMGAFRLVRNGTTSFYELMALVEHEGSLVLRLKHFDADLTGWEEKDETVEFPLVAVDGDWFRFDGLSIHRRNTEAMSVYVAISSNDGEAREAAFEYSRQAGGSHQRE